MRFLRLASVSTVRKPFHHIYSKLIGEIKSIFLIVLSFCFFDIQLGKGMSKRLAMHLRTHFKRLLPRAGVARLKNDSDEIVDAAVQSANGNQSWLPVRVVRFSIANTTIGQLRFVDTVFTSMFEWKYCFHVYISNSMNLGKPISTVSESFILIYIWLSLESWN